MKAPFDRAFPKIIGNVKNSFAVFCFCFVAAAMAGGSARAADENDISLEQLVNIKVTSVSKKETKLEDSATAITVITQEDIRRSGLTSLPELLRLVPGMDVARIDGNEWAVSSRGFNAEFATKLLVLVDGRTVYSPSSAGVFWDAQDVVLEDIDRIEVIRGPGATLWGANAVNGVINIITKSSKDTQGGLVSVAAGTEERPITTVRYGGVLATNLYYRAYVKYLDRDSLVTSSGQDARDGWNALRGGFRLDWEPSDENTATLQGDFYTSDLHKDINETSLTLPFSWSSNVAMLNQGAYVLGRWSHKFSENSQLTLQTYYDHVRQDAGWQTEYRDAYDFDLQHQFSLGSHNDIVWGFGYRHTLEVDTPSFNLSWTPEKVNLNSYSAFVQDDLTIVRDRLHFTFGSKFEHNSITGIEFQPSGRLLWTPTERQEVWAAVSRAIRTPGLFERTSRLNVASFQPSPSSPPVLVSEFGNPNVESESLIAYEAGYRIQPTSRVSLDLAGFYNVYDNLIQYVANPTTFEITPAPPHVLISSTEQNSGSARTYGTELSLQWQVRENWRLTGSYTWLHMDTKPDPSLALDSPQQQFQIHSYLDLPHHLELDGAVYYVDQISPEYGAGRLQIPSYFRTDLGIVWRPSKSLEVGIWGQNLLDSQHAEFTSLQSQVRTEVPRGFVSKIAWRF